MKVLEQSKWSDPWEGREVRCSLCESLLLVEAGDLEVTRYPGGSDPRTDEGWDEYFTASTRCEVCDDHIVIDVEGIPGGLLRQLARRS